MIKKLSILFVCFCFFLVGSIQAQSAMNNGINQNIINSKIEVKAYPNPVIDELNIETQEGLKVEDLTIRIFSLIGTEMKISKEVEDSRKMRIDMKNFPPGYYLVSIRDEVSRRTDSMRILKK
jgi:hypothetical protein